MESDSILVKYLPIWLIIGLAVGFLAALYIKSTDKKRSINQNKPDRKFFFWKFLIFSIVPPFIVHWIHQYLVYQDKAPTSLLTYVPYYLAFTAIVFLFVFHPISASARLTGNSRFYYPIVTLLGLLWPFTCALNVYRDFTETIHTFHSVDEVPAIAPIFFKLSEFQVNTEGRLEYIYYRHRNKGKYELQYVSVIPITGQNRVDSIYRAWIYFTEIEVAPELTTEIAIDNAKEQYRNKNYHTIATFNYRGIEYFRNDQDRQFDYAWRLLTSNNKMQNQPIVLKPESGSLTEGAWYGVLFFGIFYLIIFGGVCALIYVDPSSPDPT